MNNILNFHVNYKQMQLIAWKDGDKKMLIDPDEIKCLEMVSNLNDEAESIEELYTSKPLNELNVGVGSPVWKDIVLGPTRPSVQLDLKVAIQKVEGPATISEVH